MIKSIILSILTIIAFLSVVYGVCLGSSATNNFFGLMLLIPVVLFFGLLHSLEKLSRTSCLIVGIIILVAFFALALAIF